jgi:hypothetical protein
MRFQIKLKLLFICLLYSCALFAQWNTYPLPNTIPINYVIKNFYFSNSNTVWARYSSAESPTYKSSNRGQSFEIVNNYSLPLIHPINNSVFYALNNYGKLLKSTDGGVSFSIQQIMSPQGDTGFIQSRIIDTYFYNEDDGWVMGNDTTLGCLEIWVTMDGAQSWS